MGRDPACQLPHTKDYLRNIRVDKDMVIMIGAWNLTVFHIWFWFCTIVLNTELCEISVGVYIRGRDALFWGSIVEGQSPL